jgi:hypothetical protein
MTDPATSDTGHICAPTCAMPPGAALCPKSPTYWRRPENRDDGQPYRQATLDETYASVSEDRR